MSTYGYNQDVKFRAIWKNPTCENSLRELIIFIHWARTSWCHLHFEGRMNSSPHTFYCTSWLHLGNHKIDASTLESPCRPRINTAEKTVTWWLSVIERHDPEFGIPKYHPDVRCTPGYTSSWKTGSRLAVFVREWLRNDPRSESLDPTLKDVGLELVLEPGLTLTQVNEVLTAASRSFPTWIFRGCWRLSYCNIF